MSGFDDRDEYLVGVEAKIAEHGWAVQGVGAGDGEPAFAYTVGLVDQGRPELVMFGLPMNVMHVLLNDLAASDLPAPGSLVHEVANMPLRLDVVDPARSSEFLTVAAAHARGTVDAVQVVWPDREGRFPGDPGFDVELGKAQPLLSGA